jgi:hypothetical protein
MVHMLDHGATHLIHAIILAATSNASGASKALLDQEL